MADHSKPVLTSTYSNFVSELDARFDDLSVGLDPAVTTASNLPVNTIRWNSALGKDQKWNGSAWLDKSAFYSLGSVRFSNGTMSAPSITFSDDTTTGIFKPTSQSIAVVISGQEALRVDSGKTLSTLGLFQSTSRAVVYGGTGNDYNQGAIEVYGGGLGNPSIQPTIGFHQPGYFAGSLRGTGASNFGFYAQGGVTTANLSVLNLNADATVNAKDGFLTTNYVPNSRNPIWRFGDSPLCGLSYFQGSSGYRGADSIGIHFGTASSAASEFSFTNSGQLVTGGNITSGKIVNADTGTNITVMGTGTTASTAPYFTVNSRGLTGASGDVFQGGGLLFASYRDVRTTAYAAGITTRILNISNATSEPTHLDFRVGSSTLGDLQSFEAAGDAALPSVKMSLSRDGDLTVNKSVIAPRFTGTASNSDLLTVNDPESSGQSRNLAHILPTTSPHSIRSDFALSSTTGTGGGYSGVITIAPYAGSTSSTGGPSYQLGFGSSQNNGGTPKLRLRNGIDSTWNEWTDVTVPTGVVIYTAGNTAPSGYLKANGAAVSRTAYNALFEVIGTTYGIGDNSTTFNLPDLRGEFIRGWDDGRGVDSGRVIGGWQGGMVEAHNHAPPAGLTRPWLSNAFSGDGEIDSSNATGPAERNAVGGTTQSYGGVETRPRNIALLACIKY